MQITALKAEERAGGPAARPGRPRALVLGPTRELTEQLLRVAKSLAHHEKFASTCVSGGACDGRLQNCPQKASHIGRLLDTFTMCANGVQPAIQSWMQ